jgi:hypothetical protein
MLDVNVANVMIPLTLMFRLKCAYVRQINQLPTTGARKNCIAIYRLTLERKMMVRALLGLLIRDYRNFSRLSKEKSNAKSVELARQLLRLCMLFPGNYRAV